MSFSFSSLSLYNTCPFAYKLSYIDKIKPVRSTALVKGSNVHSILEKFPDFIASKEFKFHENSIVSNFLNSEIGNYFKDVLLNKKTAREFKFGLTKNFENDTFEDSFFHGIIDLIFFENDELNLCDYKTGKFKENQDFSQLLTYSIFFKKYNKIKINYLYVEHNKINSKIVTKEDIENAQNFIIKTSDIILQDKVFKRNCGKHCSWCQFSEKCDEMLLTELRSVF
jgi:CRISPR/Cas system-associated exonuclease Cas4 (RecB family)